MNEIELKLDQCAKELTIQFQSCPATLLPLHLTLDQDLKEFVQLQQKYLSNKLNYQLARFQDCIHEKELFQMLSTYSVTSDQVTHSN